LLALAGAGAAGAQNEAGDSLVNVQIGDITVLLPIGVAANICDVNANVLAEQVRTGDATCTATAESIATPGPGNGNGGGNTAGNSLVNVQIGDITIKLPIAIAANVCDVNVNVLATQLRTGEATCEAAADASG
jgi:hypothetical protein